MSHIKTSFNALQKIVREKRPDVPKFHLKMDCPYARVDHDEEWRVFAHTLEPENPNTICVHPDLELLHPRYIYGIIAHEFGHNLAWIDNEDDSEDGANRAAVEVFDLEALPYDHDFHRLEYLLPGDLKKMRSYETNRRRNPRLISDLRRAKSPFNMVAVLARDYTRQVMEDVEDVEAEDVEYDYVASHLGITRHDLAIAVGTSLSRSQTDNAFANRRYNEAERYAKDPVDFGMVGFEGMTQRMRALWLSFVTGMMFDTVKDLMISRNAPSTLYETMRPEVDFLNEWIALSMFSDQGDFSVNIHRYIYDDDSIFSFLGRTLQHFADTAEKIEYDDVAIHVMDFFNFMECLEDDTYHIDEFCETHPGIHEENMLKFYWWSGMLASNIFRAFALFGDRMGETDFLIQPPYPNWHLYY